MQFFGSPLAALAAVQADGRLDLQQVVTDFSTNRASFLIYFLVLGVCLVVAWAELQSRKGGEGPS